MSDTFFYPLETLARRPNPITLIQLPTDPTVAVKKVVKPANMFNVNVQRKIDATFNRTDLLDKLKPHSGWVDQCNNPQTFAVDKSYVEEPVSEQVESTAKQDENPEENPDEENPEELDEISIQYEGEEDEDVSEHAIPYAFDMVPMSELCVDDTVLVICSGAKNDPLPGKGSTREVVPLERKAEFIPGLSSHAFWRKMLCNSWSQPFHVPVAILQKTKGTHPISIQQLSKVEWDSVNHFIAYQKYKPIHNAAISDANLDAVETQLLDALLDRSQALDIGTSGKFQGKKLTVHAEFPTLFGEFVYCANYAKFTQHPSLLDTLIATRDATLLYRETDSSAKTFPFVELMLLRMQAIQERNAPIQRKVTKLITNKPQEREPKEREPKEREPKEREPKEREPVVKIGKKEAEAMAAVAAAEQGPLTTVRLPSDWVKRLPQRHLPVAMRMPYYMFNRRKFMSNMSNLFSTYRDQLKGLNESNGISCTQLRQANKNADFSLLMHQMVVRDYLNMYSPYRGTLFIHGLGTGKTCSSIAVAEGASSDKHVFVLTPASLAVNYWTELNKCGDPLFKLNQFWEFISAKESETITKLSYALNLPQDDIKRTNGAWLVDITKPANYYDLTESNQKAVSDQVQRMIQRKYTNIHYNANNLGSIVDAMVKQTTSATQNPFDHSIVIIDEAHNFVSRIVNKLTDKSSIYSKLYHMLMDAQDMRIVMLSGTPIVNYPNEMAVMYNMLRGYIKTWEFKTTVITNAMVTQATIEKWLETDTNVPIHDFVQYSNQQLTITRNPFGFINATSKTTNVDDNANPARTQAKKRAPNTAANRNKKTGGTRKNSIPSESIMVGGASSDYFGVIKSTRGEVTDAEFIQRVTSILSEHGVLLKPIAKRSPHLETALYDTPKIFKEQFIKEVTKPGEDVVKNRRTIMGRILGLTSYYRSTQEKLLPKVDIAADGNSYHLVRVPMSDYQFGEYAKFRKEEYDKESKAKKRALKKRVQQGQNNHEMDDIAGSYRIFSRIACNFVFPESVKRPMPTTNAPANKDPDVEMNEDQVDLSVDEIANDQSYAMRIETAINELRAKSDEVFSRPGLQKYSPKILEMINRMINPENDGLHLLYSNFRTLGGIAVVQLALESNGFEEFRIKRTGKTWELDGFDPKNSGNKLRYVLYTGTESEEQKEMVRNIYNGTWDAVPANIRDQLEMADVNENKNADGAIIKVFMITAAGAEGINLRNTRFTHIMEPYWHFVRTEQVIGRARRICSHEDLPESKRTVKVFIYLSVMSDAQKTNDKYTELRINDVSKMNPNRPVTTDENLYEISQIKLSINEPFLRLAKETAADCALYVDEHNKQEKTPLVCYGFGKVTSNEFSMHPTLEIDVANSTKNPDNEAQMEQVIMQEIAIAGVPYAYNAANGEVYNIADYGRGTLTLEGIIANRQFIPAKDIAHARARGIIPAKFVPPGVAPKPITIESAKFLPNVTDEVVSQVTQTLENRINVSDRGDVCNPVLFDSNSLSIEQNKPKRNRVALGFETVFPVVISEEGLNSLIKTSCNIEPRTAPYMSQFNQSKFDSRVYKNATEQSVLTTIDYMFKKMKTGIFVRIRNGHLVNFQLMYNLQFTNDFGALLKFPNNMSIDDYFKEKTDKMKKKNPRAQIPRWNKNVNQWNATGCLLRNEDDDRYPTTGYLAEMYDMITETCRNRKVDDCIVLLNRKDFPHLNRDGNEAYEQLYGDDVPMSNPAFAGKSFIPILSQSTTDKHADLPIPTADDWCNISEKYFADPTKENGKRVIKCTNSYIMPPGTVIPAWEDRVATVFWRGMGTGCGNTAATNPRLQLSKFDDIPGLDAGITNFTNRDKVNPVTKVVEFAGMEPGISMKKFVGRFEQLKYKFAINVEGNSAAYRFGSLFRMGFCVLNVESKYKLWFEPFLKDREHYIQVKHDLSDLAEVVAWCLSHDAECKQIAENGRKFYDRYFTREFVYDYMSDLFNASSAVVRYTTKPPFQFVPYDTGIKRWIATATKMQHLNIQEYRLTQSMKDKAMADVDNRSKYVIVVPYRDNAVQDRKGQLAKFMEHYAGSNILVVEQSDKHQFNRGALLNAGYHFLKQTYGTMPGKIVYHDVDLLLPPEIVDVYYGETEHDVVHMGKLIKDYYAYTNFLGGIIAFSGKAFEAVNGFPVICWGWGGEDDALRGRLVANRITVYRPSEPQTGLEMALPAAKDTKNIPAMVDANKNEALLLDEQIWRMNGLNSLQYNIIKHKRLSSSAYQITVDL